MVDGLPTRDEIVKDIDMNNQDEVYNEANRLAALYVLWKHNLDKPEYAASKQEIEIMLHSIEKLGDAYLVRLNELIK